LSLPKLLIAIVSCERDRWQHTAIRETWAANLNGLADYKFFLGKGAVADDEVSLECDDSYYGLMDKALLAFDWALSAGYTHIMHVGRDTYVHVPKLWAAALWEIHYAGNGGGSHGWNGGYCGAEPDGKGRWAYASGGAGSWLTAHAMRIILDSPIRHEADDLMFGWALGAAGIYLFDDPRFSKYGTHLEGNQFSLHLSRGTGNYNPEWMHYAHKASL